MCIISPPCFESWLHTKLLKSLNTNKMFCIASANVVNWNVMVPFLNELNSTINTLNCRFTERHWFWVMNTESKYSSQLQSRFNYNQNILSNICIVLLRSWILQQSLSSEIKCFVKNHCFGFVHWDKMVNNDKRCRKVDSKYTIYTKHISVIWKNSLELCFERSSVS